MTRWLAGLAIFALGFGCAQVMRVTPADAADDLGEGLQILDHDDSFELVNTGLYRYLLVVQPKAGATVSLPDISSATESVSVPKDGVDSVTVIRLVPVKDVGVRQPPQRDCKPGIEDCVGPEPILPPRPPKKVIELDPSSIPQ